MAQIFSFSDAKWEQLRQERLLNDVVYCSVCFDQCGVLCDLSQCQNDGERLLYCGHCGEEFPI